MPFTPYHLGLGAAFKAVGGRHFSFLVFGGAQVMMDLQPLAALVRHDGAVHGASHTLLGALAIGVAAGAIGKPVTAWVLRLSREPHVPLTWTAAWSGALLGTFSHVALDAVMHGDVQPWWPLAAGNGFYGLIPWEWIHPLCIALGVLGGLGVAARWWAGRGPEQLQ